MFSAGVGTRTSRPVISQEQVMKDGDTEVWMDDGPVTKAAKPSEVQIDPAPDQLPVKEIKPNRPDKVTQFLDSLEHGAGD